MEKSLLLHALSLKDRMLEPRELPLHGRVWGYAKKGTSHEGFVGHCLTMLASIGLEARDIGWRDNIMAFDARGADGVCTVVISLADDSLASKHFYFLGLWRREAGNFANLAMPQEEDLLAPQMAYELIFRARREHDDTLQLGERFGQGHLFGGRYTLHSDGNLDSSEPARFLIEPVVDPVVAEEVQLILYSLRNLMALSSRGLGLYQDVWRDNSEAVLYKQIMDMLTHVQGGRIEPQEWVDMVCGIGEHLLTAGRLTSARSDVAAEIRQLRVLFAAILGELQAQSPHDTASLWPRLQMPFDHAESLLAERLGLLEQSQKQAGVMLQLIHLRMLANQQMLLAGLDRGGGAS